MLGRGAALNWLDGSDIRGCPGGDESKVSERIHGVPTSFQKCTKPGAGKSGLRLSSHDCRNVYLSFDGASFAGALSSFFPFPPPPSRRGKWTSFKVLPDASVTSVTCAPVFTRSSFIPCLLTPLFGPMNFTSSSTL